MSTETIEPLPIQTIDTISAVRSSGQREPVFAIQEVADSHDPDGQRYYALTGFESAESEERHVYVFFFFEVYVNVVSYIVLVFED